MKAIQFSEFGGLDKLSFVELPDPRATAETAVLRVMSASINPSDVRNVQGAMHQTTLPRVPGRDYAGVVELGPPEWIGKEVWGTGGDVGFTRDGTHAELLAVPVQSLREKPSKLSFDEAATIGVSFLAAWLSLVDAAELKVGETVAIIGAGGAVGGAAAQIAKRIGARVIGVDRSEPRPDAPIMGIAESLILGSADFAQSVKEATGGKGAHVVFDMVGGEQFRIANRAVALGGRQVVIASVVAREVTFDLVDFYHNECRLYGVDTLKRDLTASAKILEELRPGFEDGSYRGAPIGGKYPLADAQEAYRQVAEGSRGRIVLHPGSAE